MNSSNPTPEQPCPNCPHAPHDKICMEYTELWAHCWCSKTNNVIFRTSGDDVASPVDPTTEVAGDIVTDSGGLVVPEHRLNPVEVVVDSHGPSIPQITDYDSLEKAKELLLSLEGQIRVHLSILGPLEENAWAWERAIADYEGQEDENDS